MSKRAPRAPDYTQAAREQSEASRQNTLEQTWANRPSQITPFGSMTWQASPTVDPATGRPVTQWTQNVELAPELQQALASQLAVQRGRSDIGAAMMGRVAQEFGAPVNWNQFQAAGTAPTSQPLTTSAPTASAMGMAEQAAMDPMQRSVQGNTYTPEVVQRSLDFSGLTPIDPAARYYSQAGDAVYQQFASRMEPEFARQESALDVTLRNRGLRPGDEAYDRSLEQLRQQQFDARRMASLDATRVAGQEAQRMFGMDLGARRQFADEILQGGEFANRAAQQALAQQLSIGGQGFGERMALADLYNRTGADQFQRAAQLAGMQFAQGLSGAQFANQARGQQFQQDLAASEYQTRLRQQQIAEEMQRRGFSLNEINALLEGQQVGMPQMPTFTTAGRADTPQLLSAAQMQGQSALDAYNARNAALGNLIAAVTRPFSFSFGS